MNINVVCRNDIEGLTQYLKAIERFVVRHGYKPLEPKDNAFDLISVYERWADIIIERKRNGEL